MKIIVNYEEATKNRDTSALTCFKPTNEYTYDIVVGAGGNEADEIFKIISEQGYLKKHDSALLDKVSRRFHSRILFRELTRAELMNIFDDIIADMKIEQCEREQLKAEVSK